LVDWKFVRKLVFSFAAALVSFLLIGFEAPAASKRTVKKTTSKAKSSKKRVTRKPARARNRQQQPSADRYREIQQALVDKGYLQREPTGVWGAESADALKRFQADQKIDGNGKLNSLTLIALGLGPKRDTAEVRLGDDHRSSQGSQRP
jgi:hypothetical protein